VCVYIYTAIISPNPLKEGEYINRNTNRETVNKNPAALHSSGLIAYNTAIRAVNFTTFISHVFVERKTSRYIWSNF